MVQRKRPRRACTSSCCQDVTSTCSTTALHNQLPLEEAMVHRQPQEQHLYPASRQRRQRRRQGKMSASWKMTMAAFLLWLCENGKNHNIFFTNNNNNGNPSGQSMVQAWGSSSGYNGTVHTTRKGLQIVGSCSKEEFLVRNVYLLCDSPGAYYRGSYTYRDSTTCTYGDKARLKLECKCQIYKRAKKYWVLFVGCQDCF